MAWNRTRFNRSLPLAMVALIMGAILCPFAHADDRARGIVNCANLIYGESKTSVCFSSGFLSQIAKSTNIRTKPEFVPVKIESVEMYQHPFAVMTGEGAFRLTEPQRTSLRNYLVGAGFSWRRPAAAAQNGAPAFAMKSDRRFPT